MPGITFTQAARPAPTSSCARGVASKSPGSVVMAITNSLMPLFSPCTADEKPDTKMAAMNVEPTDDQDQPPSESQPPPQPRSRRRLHAPLESRTRRRRILAYGLFVFSLVLMVNAFVGDNGYLATLRAQREHEVSTQALAALQTENERLADETHRLKYDPAALEEAARRELGLIRPGETLVIVKDARPARPVPDERLPR